MKVLVIAASLIAIGATSASAQFAPRPWVRGEFPYAQRYHSTCQDKAFRVRQFERRAGRDGRVDRRERETIRALERDLDRTCGRYRYRG